MSLTQTQKKKNEFNTLTFTYFFICKSKDIIFDKLKVYTMFTILS